MIVKIYRERGKIKIVGGGEEERTNPYTNYTSSQQEFQRGASKKRKKW
jgi:hypothetical protein